jgi:hypothetical protein
LKEEILEIIITWLKWDLALVLGVNLALWAWVWLVPPRLVRVRRLFGGALGLALPGLIFIREGHVTELVLRHELIHRDQMRRQSPLGTALLLGWHYAVGFLRGRGRVRFMDLYQSNPIEREAHLGQHRKDPLPRVFGWPV